MASGPRPSNRPRGLTPASASRMNARKSAVPRYPPVVPAMVKPSRRAASARPRRHRQWRIFDGAISGSPSGAPRGSGFSPVPNLMLPNARASAGSGLAATACERRGYPLDVGRHGRVAHLRVARLIAELRRQDELAGADRRPRATRCAPTRHSRSNTESGWSAPACTRSMDGGQTISWTVTPGGASIVSVVGMSVGSRGLFDCVCSPSGTVTLRATRDRRTDARGSFDQRTSRPPSGARSARGPRMCRRRRTREREDVSRSLG